jgi:hypothetical protein
MRLQIKGRRAERVASDRNFSCNADGGASLGPSESWRSGRDDITILSTSNHLVFLLLLARH